MRTSIPTMMLAATCLAAILLVGNLGSPAFAAGKPASEPLSKTYRITRANDVEFQKIEPFKVFDNLYYVGPGYVSVWLLTKPDGNIVFDSAHQPESHFEPVRPGPQRPGAKNPAVRTEIFVLVENTTSATRKLADQRNKPVLNREDKVPVSWSK